MQKHFEYYLLKNGAFISPEEVVISVSLFNAPNIDQNKFQIFIDGQRFF